MKKLLRRICRLFHIHIFEMIGSTRLTTCNGFFMAHYRCRCGKIKSEVESFIL